MSDNSHDYQTSNDVPQEQVSIENVSNAIDEKLIEDQKAQHQNANDIETDEQTEERSDEDKRYDSKFAALSRKEKEIRAREREVEQKLAEIEAKLEQFQAPAAEESKEPELPIEYRLKKDPLKVLEELTGYTYEDLTKQVLNDGEMSTDMQMRLMREELERDYKSKFEELENKLIEKEKAEEEAKYNDTITQFKSDINNFIDNSINQEGSEMYELIQAHEAYDLVYDVIEQYYEENGRILDTAEAADQVEEYLLEETTKVLKKSKKLGNWKPTANKQVAESSRQAPTLSNSQSVTGEAQRTDRLLSREESLKALAPLLKWED